jgi:trehalose 6-phosphate synthase
LTTAIAGSRIENNNLTPPKNTNLTLPQYTTHNTTHCTTKMPAAIIPPPTPTPSDDGQALPSPTTPSIGRLLLVSNRLPITIKRDAKNDFQFHMSSGGLVTGLSGLSQTTTFQWYGWPGLEVPQSDIEPLTKRLKEEHGAHPVFITDSLADRHYNGFSNSILWPLFHYHPGDIEFNDEDWDAYKEVNQHFAKTIVKDVQDGDLIWVHDYHLMLLPELLRKELAKTGKKVKIGFFLHTPFPTSEMYRILPVRRELLKGLLYSDLVGFHTKDYARHFISSCESILECKTTQTGVSYKGNFAHVGVFPIGIDPQKFVDGLTRDSVQQRIVGLQKKFDGVKLIVGVDRLDYIKGIPQKLRALEKLFTEHPEWVGKVVMVQIAIPSRQDVEEYQKLQAEVNELVGSINGRFGTVEFMPIHLLHRSVDFDELCALYAVSDMCLVTSTRDGMNLVSYEYIASQRERHGVMVLSEFTGAAQALKDGAIIVNPWDNDELAAAVHKGITMGAEERKTKYTHLERYVFRHTSAWWGKTFITALSAIEREEGGQHRPYYDRSTTC